MWKILDCIIIFSLTHSCSLFMGCLYVVGWFKSRLAYNFVDYSCTYQYSCINNELNDHIPCEEDSYSESMITWHCFLLWSSPTTLIYLITPPKEVVLLLFYFYCLSLLAGLYKNNSIFNRFRISFFTFINILFFDILGKFSWDNARTLK